MSRADEIYRATCLDILENGFTIPTWRSGLIGPMARPPIQLRNSAS